jgi:hypothetical protein
MDCGLEWEFLDAWMGADTIKSKFIGDVSKHLVDASKASVAYAPLGFLVPDVLAAAGKLSLFPLTIMVVVNSVMFAVQSAVVHKL